MYYLTIPLSIIIFFNTHQFLVPASQSCRWCYTKNYHPTAEDDEKYPEPLKGFWKTTPKQVTKEQGPTEFSVYQSGD